MTFFLLISDIEKERPGHYEDGAAAVGISLSRFLFFFVCFIIFHSFFSLGALFCVSVPLLYL